MTLVCFVARKHGFTRPSSKRKASSNTEGFWQHVPVRTSGFTSTDSSRYARLTSFFFSYSLHIYRMYSQTESCVILTVNHATLFGLTLKNEVRSWYTWAMSYVPLVHIPVVHVPVSHATAHFERMALKTFLASKIMYLCFLLFLGKNDYSINDKLIHIPKNVAA